MRLFRLLGEACRPPQILSETPGGHGSTPEAARSGAESEGLCVYCGKLPQFWGLRCLICRQKSARSVLPAGAKHALRLYRDAERQLELDLLQAQARFRIRTLLASGVVTGNYTRAICLYAGLDTGHWRTYTEVGICKY